MSYTVVIPAYNAATTIERAVNSCMQQTLLPDEIIIVNDASTDNTKEVLLLLIKRYPLIVVSHLEENKGVSYARNYGWEQVRTQYTAFLDSDDEWHKEKMQICMDYCLKLDLEMIWHDYQYGHFGNGQASVSSPLLKTSFKSLLLRSPVATCSIVVKTSTALRFDSQMRYCEDHDFLLRFAYRHTIWYLPVALARVHRKINSPGGLSGAVWKMRKGEMLMYLKLIHLNSLFFILIPFLLMYSLLKHVRLLTRQ